MTNHVPGRAVAVAVLVLGAVTAAWWATRENAPAVETDTPADAPTHLPESPKPARASPSAPPRTEEPLRADELLAMPDGSFVEPLNGVRSPPKPGWQKGRPYAPIERVERRADGRDYYVHADGSSTTTWWTWRADLGRWDAVTNVQHPVPNAPTLDVGSGHEPERPIGGR